MVFICLLFVGIICLLIVSVIYYSLKGNSISVCFSKAISLFNGNPVSTTFIGVVENVIRIFTVLLFLKGNLKDKFNELKLTVKPNSHKLFITGATAALLGILVITLAGLLIGITKFQNIGLKSFYSIASMLLLNIILFLSVGFGEEILSRGYILKQLLNSGGKVWAVSMSAFIFMLLHVGTYSKLLDFTDVFLVGVLLAYMYIKSDSLWLPIGFHFMWDFAQTIIRIENAPVNTISFFRFSVPQDIYIYGMNIGCKFQLIFILTDILLIALTFYIYKNINSKIPIQSNLKH